MKPMEAGYDSGDHKWDLDILSGVLDDSHPIHLSKRSIDRIQHCRQYLEEKLKDPKQIIYGINTGFGALCDVKISEKELKQLQENLVMSHACGTGDLVPAEIVRIILLLKIRNLSLGYSGVRLELVEKLIEFFNAGIIPKVYQLGSLGASGDLAPLAHLSLPLLGKGEILAGESWKDAAVVLAEKGIKILRLEAKEGLALLNGTQFSTAYASYAAIQGLKLCRLANMITALSLEAYNGQLAPFYHRIHEIRTQKGQQTAAKEILYWLEGSEIGSLNLESVQDPYSFRCTPQVHGASLDVIEYLRTIVENEINGVSDNPLIFPEEDRIVSGGNFHAQPIAYALDFAAVALSELGNISERRLYKLINGDRGLPSFLIDDPGFHSGLMILQYSTASIVSQNKQLCSPASVDSITSSRGQEDHVSMAANAGTRTYRIIQNVYRILASELITASQAMAFRKERKCADKLQSILDAFREEVPFIDEDRVISNDMHKAEAFLRNLVL
jgi:histidine ammonia-lyase